MSNLSIVKLVKNFLKKIYRIIIKYIFFFIYGKIFYLKTKNNSLLFQKNIKLNNVNYSIFKILDGRVYTDQVYNVAYIKNNFLIRGPSIQLNQSKLLDISSNIVLKNGTTRFVKNIKGKIFSILTGAGGNYNYWHWLFDVLPRIYLYEKFYSLKNIDKIYVPSLDKKFQKDSLSFLGFRKKQIINSSTYRHIKSKEIFATSHPNINNDERIPQYIINFLKNRFDINSLNKKKIINKIYIDRRDSESNLREFRRIVNEKEVINFLSKKGFKIIQLSKLSFINQVSIFNNAKFIIGLHGAGFANLVFCKKNTFVLEIKPKKAGNIIKKLSIDNNLKYSSINLNPIEKPIASQYGLIYLPLRQLEKILKKYNV